MIYAPKKLYINFLFTISKKKTVKYLFVKAATLTFILLRIQYKENKPYYLKLLYHLNYPLDHLLAFLSIVEDQSQL